MPFFFFFQNLSFLTHENISVSQKRMKHVCRKISQLFLVNFLLMLRILGKKNIPLDILFLNIILATFKFDSLVKIYLFNIFLILQHIPKDVHYKIQVINKR